jgi:hypothetical protein
VDTHLVPDRAQPATDFEPAMAGRITRPRRHRGGDLSTASRRASCSRRASKERSNSKEARGRAKESRGRAQTQHERKRQSNQRPRCSHNDVHHWRICGSRRTDWTRPQSQRVHRWSSWERHWARPAREGQGLDMRRPLTSRSAMPLHMNNALDTQNRHCSPPKGAHRTLV